MSEVIKDGSGITCACGALFEGYTVQETVTDTPASDLGADAPEGVEATEVVRVIDRTIDYTPAQTAFEEHVSDGDGLSGRLRCPEVARVEALAREAEAAAEAAAQAAKDAAKAERQAIDEDRRVRAALLALLEPTGGTK